MTLDFIDEIALESAKEETPTDEFEELETVELIRLVEAVELEESPMGDGISPILAVMEDLVIETLTLLVFEPEEEPPPQPAKIKAKNKILNQFIIYASHSILLIFLIFGDTTGIS